ncbi:MAG: TrmH family RNA methyltransferase [Pirellulaceae bacterium]
MLQKINSHQNPKFKSAVRLQTARGRKLQSRFLIHGTREVSRALGSKSLEPAELFLCEQLLDEATLNEFVALAVARRAPIYTVPVDLITKIAYGETASGAVLVAHRPDTNLTDETQITGGVLVVEAIEKPGNLGAVIRSADGAGLSAVVSANPVTDLFHPNCIRSSLGTCLTMPCFTGESRSLRDWLVNRGFQILAARVDGATDYDRVHFESNIAIVLGSEANGLSDDWNHPSITNISLPMLGVADSLNISATAAILSYEYRRQRREV